VGNYRDVVDLTSSLFSEQIDMAPTATNSFIVIEATKKLVGDILVAEEGAQSRALGIEELLPLFDRCKHLTLPSICNKVSGFRYLRRFGVMDNITKLRGVRNWPYVQENKFPGQGSEVDKVFVFKMSKVGLGSGDDLVKRMQAGGDLENTWFMFDHVKRVQNWTTMACHVYDATMKKLVLICVKINHLRHLQLPNNDARLHLLHHGIVVHETNLKINNIQRITSTLSKSI